MPKQLSFIHSITDRQCENESSAYIFDESRITVVVEVMGLGRTMLT